ncbi:MAG: hypothetical protein EBY48_06525, partial [Opitutae bacterium]|nr:hypothetical protein [Opitutae bacterium]
SNALARIGKSVLGRFKVSFKLSGEFILSIVACKWEKDVAITRQVKGRRPTLARFSLPFK